MQAALPFRIVIRFYDSYYVSFFQAEDGIRDVAVTGVQTCALPICAHEEVVFNEVERHLKGAPPIGNSRGGQPSWGDIQGDMPPVVEKRGEFHAHFAHNLRPQVQRIKCLLPRIIWQGWP